MTKREALIAVVNMAKQVQLDHTYKNCRFHNAYMRQHRAVAIVEAMIKKEGK
jgi:hypothetical protein